MRLKSPVALKICFILISTAASTSWAAGETKVLTFLHTNDIHGRVKSGLNYDDTSKGGLARIATLAKEIRRGLPPGQVVWADSGDLTQGTPIEFLSQGRSTIEAIEQAGIDYAIPGNHEFDWAQDTAIENIKANRDPNFHWLSSNVIERRTGKPIGGALKFHIRNMGGVKVAFIGLTTYQTKDFEWPPFINHLKVQFSVEEAIPLVAHVRSLGADLVVLVTHIGSVADQAYGQALPGVDIILGGHDHVVKRETFTKLISKKPVYYDQTGTGAELLGRMDVRVAKDQKGKWKIQSVNGTNGNWWNDKQPLDGKPYPRFAHYAIGGDITPDHNVEAAYNRFWDRWKDLERAEAVKITDTIRSDAQDEDSHDVKGDHQISRFLADRLREATHSDVTIVDGHWQGNFAGPGSVSVAQLWSSMNGYTGQNVITVHARGEAILEALELWLLDPNRRSIGVSGLTATAKMTGKSGLRQWLRAHEGKIKAYRFFRQLQEVRIGNSLIDPHRVYTVSAPMYVMKGLKSLMDLAPKELTGEIPWTRFLILNACQNHAGPVGPELDTRLRVLK